MRIGFDISQTGKNKAGCGVVADCLIRAMETLQTEHEFLLYPAVGDLFWDPDFRKSTFHPASGKMKRILAATDFQASREFWLHPGPDFEDHLKRPDIVHVNNFFAPKGLKHARLVWTLHDLDYLLHPDWSSEANRTGCFEGAFGAAQCADLVVAISEFSRTQFSQVFPHYPPERVATVPLASRFSTAPEKRPATLPELAPDSYWLSVATLQPRKNLPRLVRAWSRLRADNPSTPKLVLTGGEGWLMDDIRQELAGPGVSDGLIVTGYVDDASLAWLYANCFAFAFVALAEGFGLPPLEAMSLGAAVLCSNTSSLPEVTGDAALHTNPWDEYAIEASMAKLLAEPGLRTVLRDRGRRRAAEFSWERSARQILTLYDQCVHLPKLEAVLAGISA